MDLDPPQKGEVKVRIVATGVCHTDIHGIRGELRAPVPMVPGHESAGYVEEVGEDVTSVKPGDAVVISFLAACGKCFFCRTGRSHICDGRLPLDTERRIHNKQGKDPMPLLKVGAFAEYIVVHESQVVPISKDMPLDRAALLGCGVITGFGAVIRRAKVEPMSSVVVIGTGGVGLNSVQGAALSGADPIIAVDVLDSKLEAARAFGATHTVKASDEDAVNTVRELTSRRRADYVFVTVGSSAAIQQGFAMSGGRAMIVVVGLPPITEGMTLPSALLWNERMVTTSTMGTTRLSLEIPKLVALYQAGRYKLDELITKRYPLEQINEAIESVERGEALRNVIVF